MIIAGCRDFNNYELLREKCDYMLSKKKDTHKVIIVSGHAAGADALGEVYASERGFGLETYHNKFRKKFRQSLKDYLHKT